MLFSDFIRDFEAGLNASELTLWARVRRRDRWFDFARENGVASTVLLFRIECSFQPDARNDANRVTLLRQKYKESKE